VRRHPRETVPAWGLLALVAGLTIFAGPVTDYAGETTAQLFERTPYIEAVLGESAQKGEGLR
jgi:multicomponent K+:H+ antiporter subunit D